MTTCLANEIQQSSLTMFHPAYVSPVYQDVWEAQVWFHPSDSPSEKGEECEEGGGAVGECKWRNIKRKPIKPGISRRQRIYTSSVHIATGGGFLTLSK